MRRLDVPGYRFRRAPLEERRGWEERNGQDQTMGRSSRLTFLKFLRGTTENEYAGGRQ
jgi:hypothetical protein